MKLTFKNIGVFGVGLALILAGCSSSAKSSGTDSASDSGSGIHLDVGCMLDHVDKPSESFHYSYKYASGSAIMTGQQSLR